MKNTSSAHKNTHKFSSTQKASRLGALSVSIATGTGLGLLCFSALILIFSGLCLALDDPHSLTFALSLAAIYLSALVSGFASVKRNHKEDALLCGIATGVLFMLILSALLLFIPTTETDSAPSNAILLRLLVIPLSLVGSFLGTAQRKMKRHKKF
jgi:putative membrane protein (TIGR04086 family)